MFQLLTSAQLFDGLPQLTKLSLGLSVGPPIVTFNVVGTFNPSTLHIRRYIHPHSITIGTSTTLNFRRHIHPLYLRRHIHPHYLRRHIHPHPISVGSSIQIRSLQAHPSTLKRCRHIRASMLNLLRYTHYPSISVATYIYPLYLYLSANLFILNFSLMVNNGQNIFRALRARFNIPLHKINDRR